MTTHKSTYSRLLMAAVLALATLSTSLSHSAELSQENSDKGKPFAQVWKLSGDVFTDGGKPGAQQRKLREGNTVYVGERIKAASNGEAVLKAADGGIVAVRPGAEFIPERFSAEGKPNDRQILRLVTGSLRVISGWIGKINREEHRIITPSATIGIRGTDHEPYVLPAEMANATYRQGTYDKVNRGATSLDAGGGSIEIENGKVGYARDPNATGVRTRALMTVLLPVLLTKVPDFYVPGAFDQELDSYSEKADSLSQKQLEKITGKKSETKDTLSHSNTPSPNIAESTVANLESKSTQITGCVPKAIGEQWLGRFDQAIIRRDPKTILNLFSTDIVAKATVRSGDRTNTLEFSRDEMVQSTLSSIASLKDYQQRRVSLEANWAEGETEKSCKRIVVKSIAIEQGMMNGKPYRFEALEEYLLEKRNGEWLAIKALTTQR